MSLDYHITRQFGRGPEKVLAKFADEKDAAEFMEAKVAWDHKTKVDTTYRFYENAEVLAEVNSQDYESIAGGNNSSQGQRRTPSPFATAPNPFGSTLPTSRKPEDDEDDV